MSSSTRPEVIIEQIILDTCGSLRNFVSTFSYTEHGVARQQLFSKIPYLNFTAFYNKQVFVSCCYHQILTNLTISFEINYVLYLVLVLILKYITCLRKQSMIIFYVVQLVSYQYSFSLLSYSKCCSFSLDCIYFVPDIFNCFLGNVFFLPPNMFEQQM